MLRQNATAERQNVYRTRDRTNNWLKTWSTTCSAKRGIAEQVSTSGPCARTHTTNLPWRKRQVDANEASPRVDKTIASLGNGNSLAKGMVASTQGRI